MIHTDRTSLVGVFEERAQAEQAIEELKQAGFRDDQLGFVVRDKVAGRTVESGMLGGEEKNAGSHAAAGALTGGVIGGALSVAAALLIPGFGPIFAGGILAATLSGVALGAMGGGFVGALMGAGIPEEEARYYESEFGSGRAILIVKTHDRQREASEVLERHGAYDSFMRQYVEEPQNTTPVAPQIEAPQDAAPSNNSDVSAQSSAVPSTEALADGDVPTQVVRRPDGRNYSSMR